MVGVGRQRIFLLSLAMVEKSQAPGRIVCASLHFGTDASVTIRTPGVGGDVQVGLDAVPEQISRVLADAFEAPLSLPQRSALDIYPPDSDPASVWAELHFDLGRTTFLDELDARIRYESISLHGDEAIIEVSRPGRSARVLIPVASGVFPVHVADELAQALGGSRD